MFIKKLFTVFCAMLLSLTIMPLNETWFIDANAAVAALWPVEPEFTEITTQFNPNRNTGGVYGGHNGIDVPADANSDIYAVVGGTCVSAGWMGDYGNLIILRHENLGVYTFYAHCTSTAVTAGQAVNAGDVIGYVGNTGNSYGNHLHFGICDTLLGGYPTATYYDPETYFTYSMEQAPDNSTSTTIPTTPATTAPPVTTAPTTTTTPVTTVTPNECNCSDNYAGIYVTKNITTYLNIRSGHGSEYSIIGQIYPENPIEVIKADGNWAHIRYNNITGYCSMEYITLRDNPESGMRLSNALIPDGQIVKGNPVDLGGTITSNLPITRFTGGIYKADAVTPVYVFEKNPNSYTYSLSGEFDNSMLFNKLELGTYVYKVEAEDESGKVYPLIGISFMVVQPVSHGDINGDGGITVSDGVLLQKYILGTENLSDVQLKCADMTNDDYVDIFDMIIFRKKLIE
ncbi:MAG: peptidoglycan DD-metalloendopeptidase family protein [Ruminococcus sp.]|nr:peptidoglycan DD-metalloendopeptidase family protein [Ruminococcus sp.]